MSQELLTFLGRAPVFRTLPEEFRQYLVDHAGVSQAAAGEVLFRRGDLGEHAFVVLRGQVAELDEDELLEYSTELARRGPGDAVGLASTLGALPHTNTCRAVEQTLLMAVNQTLLLGLIERVPTFSVEVCKYLAVQSSLLGLRRAAAPAESLTSVKYDPQVYDLFPRRLLEQHRLIPYELTPTELTVATPDPDNITALDDLRRFLHGIRVNAVHVKEAEYRRFMQRHFKEARLPQRRAPTAGGPAVVGGRSGGYRAAGSGGPPALKIDYLSQQDEKASAAIVGTGDPVAELDEMVLEALNLGASDIHIEPVRDGIVVRYRVDGVLQERPKAVARGMLRALVSRVKVLAGIDISESRLPQDGRFSFNLGDHLYDMRVATMPTIVGEKVVLRILDTERASLPLEELFVVERACKLVKRLIHKPWGLLVTTGPTGSGKTTTLYASLHERRATRVNITTVEDPVEYYVPGVNQVQVNEGIGLTFPAVLRGILRQNPDVILVGEMRDAATARISLEAGLTGHLVLTSLHANTAAGALLRLLEMEMDPFTIGHAVNGIVNQRLVRQICGSCRTAHQYRPAIVDLLVKGGIFPRGFDGSLYRGVGCEACAGTGLRGRIALFEVLTMTEPLRGILGLGTTIDELTDTARKTGFSSFQQYAAHVLLQGLTTPEEVFRATGSPTHD